MKRSKLTKLLAFLLAFMMLATACNNVPSDTTKPEETKGTTPSTDPVETVKNYWEMLDDVSDTSDLPDWQGETLEVNIWCAGGTDQIFGKISDTNVTFKEFERVTGVKFVVEDCYGNGGESVDSMMPKVVASKNYPTMVWGWNIDAQMNEMYENGLLVDLTPYYENGYLDQLDYWAPFDNETMDTVLYSKMRSPDGALYKLPAVKDMTGYWDATKYYPAEYDLDFFKSTKSPQDQAGLYSVQCIMVRDDILQALYPNALSYDDIVEIYLDKGTFTEEQIYDIGLESPEDFYEMLADIKDLLASGDYKALNGKQMEVTYGPDSEWDNFDWMTYLPRAVKGWAINVDYFITGDHTATDGNILKRAYCTDEYVEYMRELNALVQADIISKNSLVDNHAAWNEKILNGHYAVVYASYSPSYEKIDSQGEGWHYRPIWINNDTSASQFGGFGTVNVAQNYAIFRDAVTDEELEQLIHAMNYLYSKVGINNFYWGPRSAGLFVENADGTRSFVDKEIEACMVYQEDNGSDVYYGLLAPTSTNPTFRFGPIGTMGSIMMAPNYFAKPEMMKTASRAVDFFNPGILPGKSVVENQIQVNVGSAIYGSDGMAMEGIKTFWAARAGFEAQIKKVIASPDFEAELQELFDYCEENAMTEETAKAWNDKWVEMNKVPLIAAGLIEEE